MQIRFNQQIAKQIGAFKYNDFEKQGIKNGDLIIRCNDGYIHQYEDNKFHYNWKGTYYVKPTPQNQSLVEQQFKMQQTIEATEKLLQQYKKENDNLAAQIQQSIAAQTRSHLVLFIYPKSTSTNNITELEKQIPIASPEHKIINFGLRFDHRTEQRPDADVLYIAIVEIPGLIDNKTIQTYDNLLYNNYKTSNDNQFKIGSRSKNIIDTGFKPGNDFKP